MSKAQRTIRQTNVQRSDAVGHQFEHSESVDDNLLPEASEIIQLHTIDPNILEWFKERAKQEQDFRHKAYLDRTGVIKKNEANNRALNVIGMICAFFIFMGGMALCYFLINNGHEVIGTIFTGTVLLSAAGLFISRKLKAINDKAPKPPARQQHQ